jgi:Novel STAND NTPase 1/WD domain, G-beta repeat
VSVASTIAPSSPYKGLAAFDDTELDALLFFGRAWETEVVAANVLASRLTVLYGPSGVGKSSLLRAGVVRTLRSDGGYPSPAAAVYGSWSGNPLVGLEEAARAAVADALGREPAEAPGNLTDRLAAWSAELGAELCLLLDQLEELFLYHPASEGAGGFLELLPELITRPGLHVNVLLGIRDDALAQLDVLKERIPGLFANSLRLDHLDRDAGRAAIVGPLDRYNSLVGPALAVAIEPELEEAVLDEVAAGRIEPGGARRGAVTNGGASRRVETPYLQLVLQRVWEVERERGSPVLRLATFRELGGAQQIVEDHLERALAALTPTQQDAAASVFGQLVTPSGTKIAHGVSDLASYAAVPESELEPMLQSLARERILRPLGNGRSTGAHYEIFHDVLAEAVLGWRRRHDAEAAFALEREEARRRHSRLVALLVAATAALVLVSLLAVYAVTQRGRARDQARSAEIASLVSGATANLEKDPELGMILGLRAAAIGESDDLEDVLRRSLENSRLRGVASVAGHGFGPGERTRAALGGTSAAAQGERVLVRAGRRVAEFDQDSLVRAVDIASDGKVAWGGGATATLWDPRHDAAPVDLIGHAGTVLDVRFSPDATSLATASADGTARLWRVDNGYPIATMFGHGNWVTRLAFSPDGSTLATASDDKTARLWEAGTGRPLATLVGHRGAVTDLRFEDGGAVLVTRGTDGRVLRWDGLGEPRLTSAGTSPAYPVTRATSSSGRRAVIEGRVVRLSGGGGRERTLLGHFDEVNSVAFSSDGRLVVTASRDKDARVWDAATGDLVQLLRGHFGSVAAASFSPDARWVVTAGPHSAGLWEVASGRLVDYLRGHRDTLVAASFLSDEVIATADKSGEVRAYTCETCGRLNALVRLARRRLAATGRELTRAEKARYLP